MAAHTNPQSKRRAEAMASELRQWADWKFDVTCGTCGQQKTTFIADFVPRHGSLSVGEVSARLRCSIPRCGGRPSRLILLRGSYEITLIGVGTFG